MLDLSYLKNGAVADPPPPTDAALDAAYQQYAADAQARHPGGVAMSASDFERYSLGSNWLGGLKDVAKKVVQACRLVVGIHDYEYYLDHMRSRHPEATPLTREAFYRYCLEARFPSAERAGSRCPC